MNSLTKLKVEKYTLFSGVFSFVCNIVLRYFIIDASILLEIVY